MKTIASTAAEHPPLTTERRVPAAPTPWIVLIVTGAIGGILSGLFAIGGAILMVPLLVWRTPMDQRQAAATSLVAIIPTTLVSATLYLMHGRVDVVAAVYVSAGAMAGAVIGSRMLRRLSIAWLHWVFIAFLLLVAARMVTGAAHHSPHALAFSPTVAIGYLALGVLTGIASGLFGIGGAIISVPILGSVFALGDVVAKGTALLVSLPTSVTGTMAHRRSREPVDIGAGLIIGLAAAVTSVPAVYVAVDLPPAVSSPMFAVLLLGIAVQLTITTVRSRGSRSVTSKKGNKR